MILSQILVGLKSFIKRSGKIYFISLIGTFLPYMAYVLFNGVLPHGLISFDFLLLVSLFSLKKVRLLTFAPILIAFCIVCIFEDSPLKIGAICFYTLILLLFLLCKKIHKRFVSVAFFCLAVLGIFITDANNFLIHNFHLEVPELLELASFFIWGIALCLLVPMIQVLVTAYFSRKIIVENKNGNTFVFTIVHLVLALLLNFIINSYTFGRQPILDFTLYKYLEYEFSSKGSAQYILTEKTKNSFKILNNKTDFLDSSRSTVFILAESFGVPKEPEILKNAFAVMDSNIVHVAGIYKRGAIATRDAEFEELEITLRDLESASKVESPLLKKYKKNGFKTIYLHGYTKTFYDRDKLYPRLNFDSLLFDEDLKDSHERCHFGFEGICDEAMLGLIDTLLNVQPSFIFFTSLDSHFPYDAQKSENPEICEKFSLSHNMCVNYNRVLKTLSEIHELAKRHPETRFIIVGDHRPPSIKLNVLKSDGGSDLYYMQWVPVIVLN